MSHTLKKPTQPQTTTIGTHESVSLDDIDMPTWQRRPVDEAVVDDLAESITRAGLLHPPTVRRQGERLELVAGQHRLEALKKLGVQEMVVMVTEADDRGAEAVSLIENLRRKPLSPSEEAAAITRLHELLRTSEPANTDGERAPRTPLEGTVRTPDTTHKTSISSIAATAKTAGVSRSKASRALTRLEKASPEVRAAVAAGELLVSIADELTKFSMAEQNRILPDVKGKPRDEARSYIRQRANPNKPPTPEVDAAFVAKVAGFVEVLRKYEARVASSKLHDSVLDCLKQAREMIDTLLAIPTQPPAASEPTAPARQKKINIVDVSSDADGEVGNVD